SKHRRTEKPEIIRRTGRARKRRRSALRLGGEIFARSGIGLLSLYRPVAQGRQGNGDAADGATHKGAGGQNSELAVAIVQAGRLARVLRNLRAHGAIIARTGCGTRAESRSSGRASPLSAGYSMSRS